MLASNILRNIIYTGIILFTDLIKEDTISKDISNIFFNLHIITTIIAVIITVVYVWIYN